MAGPQHADSVRSLQRNRHMRICMAKITEGGGQDVFFVRLVPVMNAVPPPTNFTTGSSESDVSEGSTILNTAGRLVG